MKLVLLFCVGVSNLKAHPSKPSVSLPTGKTAQILYCSTINNANKVTSGNVSTFGSNEEESFVRMHKKAYWVHAEAKTYAAAVAQCREEGGKLAEPKSAQANNDLIALARTINFPQDSWKAVWIGINDKAQNRHFVYESDGRSVEYTHWNLGPPQEPDNEFGVEHCVVLYSLRGYDWCDAVCLFKNSFICERV